MNEITGLPVSLAAILAQVPLAPLGPGSPMSAMRPALGADDATLFGPLDRNRASACRAGLWLAFGFLEESHTISQGLSTREGSYWHALMHRREPDHANAAYWFRRVGTHPIFELLREAAARIATEFEGKAGGPMALPMLQHRWDPFMFEDLCEVNAEATAPWNGFCLRVQRVEWDLLFAWCFDRPLGK